MSVTLADVDAAAAAFDGAILRTPCALSRTLSDITGAEVVLMFENLQFTASYKERGALWKLLSLSDDARAAGVVTMSAGNHAQAVAHHARRLGIDATIVMPADTPLVKVTRTEHLGARVVLTGTSLAEAAVEANRLVAAEGRTLIPPYDDAHVVAGQGTVAREFLADRPDLDALIVPVGGGGLLAGTAIVAMATAPDVELIGVQSELYPAMACAINGNEADRPEAWGPTIAEGIAVTEPGVLPREIIQQSGASMVTVSEPHIEEAVALYLEIEKVVVEGAGAAGLAALLEHRDRFAGRRVGLIITGGNIDLRLLASVIMRGLVRTGRLTRLSVELSDRPGSLGRLTAAVGEAGGNIVEVTHQRDFAAHSARLTEVLLVIETRDAAHAVHVVEHLGAAGFTATRVRP